MEEDTEEMEDTQDTEDTEDTEVPPLEELPEPVRSRVASLCADVLPDVVRLPASLRRVAAFAPPRRARLGGTTILRALAADDALREGVAVQLAARPAAPPDRGPAEVAARAWLLRPEGWTVLVREAVRLVDDLAGREGIDPGELARLRGRLDASEQAVRDLRARHRAQVEELKAENAALRRKLGQTRAAERAAREAVETSQAAHETARQSEATRLGELDKEVRRLRARLEQAEQAEQSQRRAVRSERDDASLRARLLLDTVLDAAAGLRRELALPPVSGAPADRLEAELVGGAPGADARTPSSAGALGPGSSALLEQYLAMPRARLLVDGYNVSKAAWPTSSLEAQRIRLLNGLAPVVARTGVETTVVFDAAATTTRPVVATPRGVKVVFSPPGVIADDVLRDLVGTEPAGRVVVVVSDDREVVDDVTRAGARAASTGALLGLL